jgi:uncharacterized membrane protein
VLAVVIWIGGVAMVTMAVLPAVRDGDVGPNRVEVFEAIERRFTCLLESPRWSSR